MTAVDHAIEIDFGRYGLGGVARAATRDRRATGTGWPPATATTSSTCNWIPRSPAKTRLSFSRLLGDVNGDGTVDRSDVHQVAVAIVHPNSGVYGDVNGDGRVNLADLEMARRWRGRTLAQASLQTKHAVQHRIGR